MSTPSDNIEAWIMRDTISDQRDENRCEPDHNVTFEELSDLGIWCYHMDPSTMLVEGSCGIEGDKRSKLDWLADKMRFVNRDEVCCSPEKLPDYDAKLKIFFTEHIHEDDEIRLIKAGSGYFDVRNPRDQWVRIWVKPGNLIVIPAGIYHRFTMDRGNYTHAIRLFAEAPKWTAINRPCDENQIRLQYMTKYHRPGGPARETILGPANDVDNVYIQHPSKFDETMKPLMRAVSATAGKDMLVLFITGEALPVVGGSWCPDCEPAIAVLRREVQRVREKWAADKRRVVFVQAAVNRQAYLRNPDYLYRNHPFTKVTKGVPTVLVAAGTDDEGFMRDRQDGEVPDSWKLPDQ